MSHVVKRKQVVALLAAAGLAAAGLLFTAGPASATVVATTISLKSVTPALGSTAGGSTITLAGKGFQDNFADTPLTNITVGGTAVTSITVVSDISIVAKVPTGTAGAADIVITGVDTTTATLAGKFTYVAPIDVTVAASTLNPLGGGALTVTTTGTFGADLAAFKLLKTTAKVGTSLATMTYVSPTTATLKVPVAPSSATPVKVQVFSNGVAGAADTTHATYAAVISKLSVTTAAIGGVAAPASGKPAITITGKGLLGATAILVGGTAPAGSCTVVSDTSVTCTDIPAHTAGPVAVTFTSATGPVGTTAGATFTYTDII